MKVYVGNEVSKGKKYDLILVPGKNLYTGANSFIDQFGELTSLEIDILNLASGIYAIDLAAKRDELENYIRTIDLTIEVVNIHVLERIKNTLLQAIYTLSCDNWIISFSQIEGRQEDKFEINEKYGIVLLFSGGLDSLCGATYFLGKKIPLHLVSHINQNRTTSTSQQNLFAILKKSFKEQALERTEFRVTGRKSNEFDFPEEREDSQRLRSFLFLSLAALVSRRIGYTKIISLAENGQFAIHLPLSEARVGPFSTHTADPRFIIQMQDMFKTLLNLKNLVIENPFLYLTKAEILQFLPGNLSNQIAQSVSCWKASRISGKTHCGECIPCFTRRIALEHNGVTLDEYDKDVFSSKIGDLSPDDEGKRNMSDFLGFINLYRKIYQSDKKDLLHSFPELLNEAINYDKAVDMYYRMTTQAVKIFKEYPEIKKLLK